MAIRLDDIEVGDEVTIKGTVQSKWLDGGWLNIQLHGHARQEPYVMHVRHRASHTPMPRPLAVGDEVSFLSTDGLPEVQPMSVRHGRVLALTKSGLYVVVQEDEAEKPLALPFVAVNHRRKAG